MTKSERTRTSGELELRRLAALKGIRAEWRDLLGNSRTSSEVAIKRALALCGVPVESEAGIEGELKRFEEMPVQPVYVIDDRDEPVIAIRLSVNAHIHWQLSARDGTKHSGTDAFRSANLLGADGKAKITHSHKLRLPRLHSGLYKLAVQIGESDYTSHVFVSPPQCYAPESVGLRMWGPFIGVASLRSSRNWGVGDFTDLANFCTTTFEKGGAGIVAIDAIQPMLRHHVMSCSSLSYIDPVYIDVESIPDYNESEETKRTVLAPDFQQRLANLREAAFVDFASVLETKMTVLGLVYQRFRQEHLLPKSARGRDFKHFQQEQGSSLRSFAVFQCLSEHNKESDWHDWPEYYRNPESDAVAQFVTAYTERIEFYEYLQWIADLQIKSVGILCSSAETPLGLCRTVPFYADPCGFEAWRHQSAVAKEALSVMPATLSEIANLASQCAFIPSALQESGYAPFVEAVRSAQRYASAIYLPNISALERQVWKLGGIEEVIEVQYAFNELLAILKVESHRARCCVITSGLNDLERATDGTERDVFTRLGLIPLKPVFSPTADLFSDDTQFDSGPSALLPVAQSNQSLFSYWMGFDVPAQELTAGSKNVRDSAVAHRVLERVDVLRKLEEHSLLPEGRAVDPTSASVLTLDVSAAFYKMIAARPESILLIPLEDLAGRSVVEKTVSQYSANEKLALSVSELYQQALVIDLLSAFKKSGRTKQTVQHKIEQSARVQATIPQATYRFQFHKDFPLRKGSELISYLHELGISHVYTSPLLVARAGSMHGYDIVNHKELNPELGTTDDLEKLSRQLKKYGMGLVLDMVPNHMGIGKQNAWWMDVLENGPASQFAEYFDIDWRPVKQELAGKVTIPVLGEFYGNILHSGQLKLRFYPERGALVLAYYENEYPINPVTYPVVLNERIELLKERLGCDNFDVLEYQSVITALSHLPGHMEPVGFSERIREKLLQMRRLSELCKRNPAITEFIEQNLRLFEVQAGDRVALQRMHSLLESQAYRLVQWRVANDEINYRRFFDINDLAAVRTEDPRVFTEMHDLVLKWVGERKVDGLRIDHPDGLFDPAGYFRQLQQAASEKLGGSFTETEMQKHELPFYILVEKILAPFERLEDWSAQGTTGYDYLNEVLGILVNHENEESFTRIYESVAGKKFDYEEMKRECKKIILDSVLASELNVLAHRLSQIAESSLYYRDFTLNSLRYALRQIVISFPVYRTYVLPGKVDKTAHQFIDWAIGKAKRLGAASNTAVYDFIRSVLTLEASSVPTEQNTDQERDFKKAVQTFAMKFQQFTSPVMAKSFEDTLFYRYVRFAALNEVGGEPDRFGSTVAAFHQRNQQRQQRHPYSMLATSTHDTKRSEDVRARLAVISELPNMWEQRMTLWTRMNKSKKASVDDEMAPDSNDEYLLYQTIVGAWPIGMSGDQEAANFRERIKQYMLKAVREAKRMTSWVNQNVEYETALTNFVDRILTPSSTNAFFEDVAQFSELIAPPGLINSLVQTTLKATCPGVPDVYQGNELWDFSLVDPDNRRPVDYGLRKRLLGEMQPYLRATEDLDRSADDSDRNRFASTCFKQVTDGRLKMYVLGCLLRFRRTFPKLFTDGKYIPLEITGSGAGSALAFARELNGQWLIVVVPLLVAALLGMDDSEKLKEVDALSAVVRGEVWNDTAVTLPEAFNASNLTNLFTSQNVVPKDQRLLLSALFRTLPLAVLSAS